MRPAMYENRLRDVMGLDAPVNPAASNVLAEMVKLPCGCPACWYLEEAYFPRPGSLYPMGVHVHPLAWALGWRLAPTHVCVAN